MCTFYVLPPRSLVGDHFAGYLRGYFPGLDWDRETRVNLADAIGAAATCLPDIYVVHREDLPEGESTWQALVDGFGAEDGDEVVEVRVGPRLGELTAQRWRLRRSAA